MAMNTSSGCNAGPFRLAVAMSLACAALPALGADHLSILTFPVGLVVGEHEFEVDLGPSRAPAELHLDGSKVCVLGGETISCTVDLGNDPKVHQLELVRYDSGGNLTAKTHRWINRPGQEAELSIHLEPRGAGGVCRGSLVWLHPEKLSPSLLRVEHNSRALKIAEDGRSFAFPCSGGGEADLVAASAVFPDGRRAEAVALSGGFGDRERVSMTAVALTTGDGEGTPCKAANVLDGAKAAEDAPFEVVFVLDPKASYRSLVSTQSGERTLGGNSWRRAEASLWDAGRVWYVQPDDELHRIDGHSGNREKGLRSESGRDFWLEKLFLTATRPIRGEAHLADAVAASGLVAGGPRRRVIILFLGNRAERDASTFTSGQAQAYLEEIGVPLRIVRLGKVRDDGWPAGTRVTSMRKLAEFLEGIHEEVSRQCITWFEGDLRLDEVSRSLPEGVSIAGRTNRDPEGPNGST